MATSSTASLCAHSAVLSAGEPSVGQFSSVMFNVNEGDDDDDQD